MAVLDRRVQLLLDPRQYAALEREAEAQKQTVSALIREAVDERLNRAKQTRREALDRLFARADEQPEAPPIVWSEVKDSFESDFLRDLP